MAQRGYSSVGRAPPLHGGCQRFESAYLHIKYKKLRVYGGYLGIQKRRRTWLPAKCFGELVAL
eukprot:scaffold607457_cov1498-Attheya_sp.AAC.1